MKYIALLSIPLLAVFAFSGCSTTTGVTDNLTASETDALNNIAVYIAPAPMFDVDYHRDRMGATGAAVGGLLGYAIHSGITDSKDEEVSQQMDPAIQRVMLDEALTQALVEELDSIDSIQSTRGVRSLEAASADEAVLSVVFTFWGLGRCSGNEELQGRLTADIEIKLLSAGEQQLLWQEVNSFTSDCRYPSDYSAEIVEQDVDSLVQRIAQRIKNEILYAK